jgi:triacylglycerol lipase
MVIAVPIVSALVVGAAAYRQAPRPATSAVVAPRGDRKHEVRQIQLLPTPAPELTTHDQWDDRWVDRLLRRRERAGWRLERGEMRVAALRARMTQPRPLLDAGGMPVLLVPGMGCPHSMLAPMAGWLRWMGFQPRIVAPHHGLGCGEASVAAVLQALEEITGNGRRKAVVLAHSRGGQFARVAAVRAPDLVAGLITLGSPTASVFGVRPRLALPLVVVGVLGTIASCSVVGISCLVGGCCRQVRRDLTEVLNPNVRYLSVFSRCDGAVNWRSCLDPSARLHEVLCSHDAMVYEPAVMDLIEEELATLCSSEDRAAPVVVRLAHGT